MGQLKPKQEKHLIYLRKKYGKVSTLFYFRRLPEEILNITLKLNDLMSNKKYKITLGLGLKADQRPEI